MDGLLKSLEQYGADVPSALNRCAGDQALYAQCIHLFLEDPSLAAFDAAHTIKGVSANLSLTPLYDRVCRIVEPLRHKENADYAVLLHALEAEWARLGQVVAQAEQA